MNLWLRWWLRVLVIVGAHAASAQAAGPPIEPILRIEAGMHTATINAVATDAAGRYAVTGSQDKTARVWDVASGRLLRTLRPPIGPGDEGKLFAVALSPDGRTVAVGGWTGWDWDGKSQVYVFDRASGRLERRLGDLPNAVTQLRFSPDGRYLAAGLGRSSGIRVWRLAGSGAPMQATDYDAHSYGVAWSRDGRLATTSLDGKVRLYRVDGDSLQNVASIDAPGSTHPFGIAFSPDGVELAVGYEDAARVDILDGLSLRLRFTPDNTGTTGPLFAVTWSADGRDLLAGGGWYVSGRAPIRRWPKAGRGTPVDVPTAGNGLMSLQPLPDGRVLVGAADPSWGVFDPRRDAAGAWQALGSPPIADLRSAREDLGYATSADGREIQFKFVTGQHAPHRFDVIQRRLLAGSDDRLLKPKVIGLPVENWLDAPRPALGGRPLALQQTDLSRSLAIAADASAFVLGTDYSLRHFDAQGRQRWEQPVPGNVWGVTLPPAAALAVAAYGDGTIRWHRVSDGRELLAFFPHADRKRWVLWTPSGYYDASAGGEELIGWHVNRGADAAADFFPASKFRDSRYRPDIIDQVLQTLDEGRAVAAADAARGTRTVPAPSVAQVLPPVVELVSGAELSTREPQVTLRYRTRSAADAPVIAVFARVNGQAVPRPRNLEPVAADGVREIVLVVPAQDSRVELFAENRHGTSVAASVQVKWSGAALAPAVPAVAGAAGFQIRPKLYVLAIGVAAYQHKDIPHLAYAAKDARDFARALQRQKGRLYSDVEVKLVTDGDATRDNIVDALDWLQRQVTQHDVGMVFFSGHGTNDASLGYTFLPVNADPDKLKRTGVTMGDFITTLKNVPGKAVAFLDTCHSGNVFGQGIKASPTNIDAVVNELASAENGVVVFSSSTGRQFSLEDASWTNGAFTKALIEGLDGEADPQRSGRVTFKMLDLYVTQRVKVLTNGRQSPTTQAPGGVNDFPLVLLGPVR